MSKWYDNTVFYHMYPLGMSGAPFENLRGEDGTPFSGAGKMASTHSKAWMRCRVYRTAF